MVSAGYSSKRSTTISRTTADFDSCGVAGDSATVSMWAATSSGSRVATGSVPIHGSVWFPDTKTDDSIG